MDYTEEEIKYYEGFAHISEQEMIDDIRDTYAELRHAQKMLRALGNTGDRREIMKYKAHEKESKDFLKKLREIIDYRNNIK